MSSEQSKPQTESLNDMPTEEFRRYGHELIDWIADYLEHPERFAVLPAVKPGFLRAVLPGEAPERGEDFSRLLEDWERLVLPGVTHWNHPGFLAYFAITGSGPGILGELLSQALNVNAMLWRTGPAATELEEVVVGWLRKMIGLPHEFLGVVMDTASVSSFCAMAAAREAAAPELRTRGMAGGPRFRVYTSEQAHSSIEKGAIAIGIGQDGVRKIPVDAEFRMEAGALAAAIGEDRAAGWQPLCAVATVGTTSTTSVDPVAAIAAVCAAEGIWLHIDAAYAGAAAILPEFRHILAGAERADSLVMNPHKWMFTPFDFSAFFCRRPQALRGAFSLVPEYLRTAEDETARNYMDYGIQLGRRFRALKFWFVLRYFGQEGMRARLREHIRLAQLFASWVDGNADFERLAPAPFSVVCLRARPAGVNPDDPRLDAFNSALLDAVNASGQVFLSHTKLHGRFTVRLAVGNLRTTEEHVRTAWDLLRREAGRLAPGFFNGQ
jgi:aromatic-L-amino-acid decarboxylase